MFNVIGYALAVAAALSVVGFCAEKLAMMRGMARRYFWLLAMLLSIAWPLVMTARVQPESAAVVMVASSQVQEPAAAAVLTPLPVGPSVPGAGRLPQPQSSRQSPAPGEWFHSVQQWVLPVWASASAALLLYLLVMGALLQRRAARWRRENVLGRDVLVSESTGPALLGALRPRVVVPGWFLHEPAGTQVLILAHEEQHVAARDPLLLRLAQLLLVVAPWNLPLWWQMHRLRLAIEMDCDARVLRAGAEAGAYGEVLLAVTRRAGSVPAGALAMGEPVSALERRIKHLTNGSVRYTASHVAAAVIFWSIGIGVAVALQAPALPRSPAKIAVRGVASVTTPQLKQESPAPVVEPPATVRTVPAPRPVLAAAQTPTPSRGNSAQRVARSEVAQALPRLLPPTQISRAPDNYDDSRSAEDRIGAAVLAARPDLLSGGGGEPKLVIVFLTHDGKVDRSYVIDDPWQYLGTMAHHMVAPDGIVPELMVKLWEPLDLRPDQLGQMGHTYVDDGLPSSNNAAFVLYAWPHRPGEPLGGSTPDDGYAFRSSFTYADAVAVIERHLPAVFVDKGGAPPGIPWVLFSPQGEVVDSGYLKGRGNRTPGIVIQSANPGMRIYDALGVPVVKKVNESPTVQVVFGWLAQE